MAVNSNMAANLRSRALKKTPALQASNLSVKSEPHWLTIFHIIHVVAVEPKVATYCRKQRT